MKHNHLKTVLLSAFLIFGLSAAAEDTPCGSGIEGASHPNGGGFVAATATVDKTAFVGPQAAVCGQAKVFGNARVSGNARVFGHAVVGDNAVVGGESRVGGKARVYGESREARGYEDYYPGWQKCDGFWPSK